MFESIRGRVAWVFEDHFDADLIVGVENIKNTDPAALAAVAMRAYDPDFAAVVRPGDILVAGRNFGYGHPHGQPGMAMRAMGIRCVIAESFSPAWRRNETFNGMILITCPGITSAVRRWDELAVDWPAGIVRVERTGQVLQADRPDERTLRIVEAGGFVNYLKRSMGCLSSRSTPSLPVAPEKPCGR